VQIYHCRKGSPLKPLGQEQTAAPFLTSQSAFTPQLFWQGFSHWLFLQTLKAPHSASLRHSPLLPMSAKNQRFIMVDSGPPFFSIVIHFHNQSRFTHSGRGRCRRSLASSYKLASPFQYYQIQAHTENSHRRCPAYKGPLKENPPHHDLLYSKRWVLILVLSFSRCQVKEQ